MFGRQAAPNFSMLTTKNLDTLDHRVTLDDYKGKWLIFFFYPADFTFVCPTEITAFSERIEDFQDLIPRFSAFRPTASTAPGLIRTPEDQGGLGPINFPLASDITKEVSRLTCAE